MGWTGDGNRGMGRNNREKRARRLQAVVPLSAWKRPSDPGWPRPALRGFFRLGMLLAREELHCCTMEDGRRKAPARPFGKWSLIGRQNAALMARSLSSPKF